MNNETLNSFNFLVRVCHSYLKTLEEGSPMQESLSAFVNAHATNVAKALDGNKEVACDGCDAGANSTEDEISSDRSV